jgi:hypothetical protein
MTKQRSPGETTMVISLPKALKMRALAYAKAHDMTLSKFVRQLIREHLGIQPGEDDSPSNVTPIGGDQEQAFGRPVSYKIKKKKSS